METLISLIFMEQFRPGKKDKPEKGREMAQQSDASKKRPAHIRIAIAHGDIEQLRISGRAGARKSNKMQGEKRANNEAEAAFWQGKAAEDERKLRESRNEHIIPIDPEHD
jgi:hypothetical protein